jgi:dCTP deaminase
MAGAPISDGVIVIDGGKIRAVGPTAATPIPPDGIWLKPGGLYTADSLETFGSTRFVPIVHGKSSIARAGLFVHVNGDMVDLGLVAPFTFQLVPIAPILVKPGMAIGQVTFWTVADAI